MTAGVRHALASLPRGGELDAAAWRRRHLVVLWSLAAHLPVLIAVGVVAGRAPTRIALDLVPIVAAFAAGFLGRGRGLRSAAVTLGLVWATVVLIDLSGGRSEARLHYFIVFALVALYEDWRPFALAVGLVMTGYVLGAALFPAALYASETVRVEPWPWTLLNLAVIVVAASAFVVFWGLHEREQRRSREYWQQLYQGERALVGQLRAAEDLKDELVAIVSHEFRTPLTSILGFASTLRARIEELDRDQALTCARAIERQTKRLSQLVGNLLAASGEIEVDVKAVTGLHVLAEDVVTQVAEFAPSAPRLVHIDIPGPLAVAMTPASIRLVLVNLVDNALKFAVPHTAVRVRARPRDGRWVAIEVENTGGPISDGDRDRIFNAFVQGDSSDSRPQGGLGLGLHIVRKVAIAHGGVVEVRNTDDRVVFGAIVPRAESGTVVVRVDDLDDFDEDARDCDAPVRRDVEVAGAPGTPHADTPGCPARNAPQIA